VRNALSRSTGENEKALDASGNGFPAVKIGVRIEQSRLEEELDDFPGVNFDPDCKAAAG
jgi:hypothetical protein